MIPAVVITGFLGSGKTTLLNRLIAARAGVAGRWALIVNELGEVGIDGTLLPATMTRQVELPGGCICCVLNDDLDRTILELLGTTPELDTIVIETTGVAEPLPIAWAFDREPLASQVRLAAVITLVDATHFMASRAVSEAVEIQVEYADALVLTKLDLATAEAEAEVRAAVTTLAPQAPVIDGSPAEVVDWLWGVLSDPPLERTAPRPPERDGEHDGHDHGHHGVDSVWLPIDGVLDLEELTDALGDLPPSYVRIKGLAEVIDRRTGSAARHWVAFHRVGLRVSWEPVSGPTAPRVVALGPGVSTGPLAACLARAVLS